MWELDYKESWVLQNWCFWTVVLEKTLESPLDCKEIQLVHSEGDQSWVFIGRTGAKAETPILWPPHAKSWLLGKDWCWEGLGAGGEGDNREWDGWMVSPTRWMWVWVNSGSWWWTGRPGVLRFMGSQRVGHDWATELSWCCKIDTAKDNIHFRIFWNSYKPNSHYNCVDCGGGVCGIYWEATFWMRSLSQMSLWFEDLCHTSCQTFT